MKASQIKKIMSKKQAPVNSAPVQKPIVSKEMANKAMSLRAKFLNLPKVQQDACVHYFNLYNALGYWWNEILSADAREYVDSQVLYAEELRALENKDKQALAVQGVDVSDYNPEEGERV